jgi:hypothetical protein
MTAKPPPTPPEQRSPKGAGDPKTPPTDTAPHGARNTDPDHKGRGANIKQNTTNQGYQQDR